MKLLYLLIVFVGVAVADKYILNCFDRIPDHGVVGSRRPLAELWGVTAYDCLKWCIAATGRDISAICKAVVYHKHHWSCQIYGTNGLDEVGFRIPAYGHDLYGMGLAPELYVRGFLLFLGMRARLSPGESNRGALYSGTDDELTCLQRCYDNDFVKQFPAQTCMSVNLQPAVSERDFATCELLEQKSHERQRPQEGGGILENKADELYAEKFCLARDAYDRCREISPGEEPYVFPSTYGRRPSDEHFIRELETPNEDDCVNECIRERDCQTAVYDFGQITARRCTLYSATLLSSSDGVDVADSVLSVENICIRRRRPAGNDYIEPPIPPTVIRNVNPLECYRVCSNTGPGGPNAGDNIQICRSGNIIGRELGQTVDCELHTIRAEPNGPVTLVDDRRSLYLEKFCLPDHPAAENCFDEVFFVHLDVSIDASPIDVVEEPLETYHQCAEMCVSTEGCRTSSFDITSGLCALFSQDIQNNFTPKFRQEGLYTLENGCLQKFKQRAAVFTEQLARLQSESNRLSTFQTVPTSRVTKSQPATTRNLFISTPEPSTDKSARNDSSEFFVGQKTDRSDGNGILPGILTSMPWSQWSPCQFTVQKQRVRVRSRQCQISDCPPGSLQVQTCAPDFTNLGGDLGGQRVDFLRTRL